MSLWIIAFSGLFGACAVTLGALSAHLWKSQLTPEAYGVLTTALSYLLVHAVVLLLAGILVRQVPGNVWFKISALLFAAGIILFCGGLILRSVTGLAELARGAPYGGIALIFGWLTIGLGGIVWRSDAT